METYDKDFPDKKTLITKIKANEFSKLQSNHYLSLLFKKTKIFLCIYDKNKNLIEQKSYIKMKTIKKHLLTKLKKLAIIKASKKIIDNNEYFRYYLINFYTLKSYKTFVNMLKNGEIEISLISRISRSGNTIGKHKNKNIVFQIKKENIDKLFNNIYTYDNDSI